MHRLEPDSLHRVRPIFRTAHAALVVDAVLAGHTPMDAWVDDPDNPRSAFLWDGAHSYYLAGLPSDTFLEDLVGLLHETVVPEAGRRGRLFFKAYTESEDWLPHLSRVFHPVRLRSMDRVFYAFEGATPTENRWPAPAGYTVRSIDANLLYSDLSNAGDLRSEVLTMWRSLDDFRKNSFGFCATHQSQIVGWCTAEYLSPGKCGLGVETVESYQRRGLATALAGAAVRESLKRDLTPHWDSWTANAPSIRVAEKIGFRKVETYAVHLGTWPAS